MKMQDNIYLADINVHCAESPIFVSLDSIAPPRCGNCGFLQSLHDTEDQGRKRHIGTNSEGKDYMTVIGFRLAQTSGMASPADIFVYLITFLG
jgi:hypothetical protein